MAPRKPRRGRTPDVRRPKPEAHDGPPDVRSSPSSAGGARLPWLLGIFLLALAVRLLHVWQIHGAAFFDLRLGDAAAYDQWARQIVGGDWIGHDVFYQAPLYPYFLALIYATLGSSVLIVRTVQAVLSAAACALLAHAGWRFFSKRIGLVAGAMLALYPPSIFLDTLVQKSAVDLFFLCLSIWLLSRLVQRPSRGTIFWLGAALGGFMLTRENALVLVVPMLLWVALQHHFAWRARAALGACLLAGLAVVLLPVATRNAIVGGEFYVTTSQFGPNFYIGNNPHADGTYQSLKPRRGRAQFERQDATDIAEAAEGRRLTPADVSGYFTDQALAFIRNEPGHWLDLLARKFALTWNSTEISDTEDQYTAAAWSWPLKLGVIWNLGVLAPLAILGLWITWDKRREIWILYVMLAAYVASVTLFYVFARYRFPIVPFLILFAAAGCAGVARFVRARPPREIVACAVLVVAVAVFCNWPMIPIARLEATTHYNYGVGLEAEGRQADAVSQYQQAIELLPTFALAHNDLGLLYGEQGHLAEATAELTQAVRLDPTYAKAENNLGVVLGQQGNARDAAAHFERAARLDPTYADPHRNLAQLLAAAGQADEASREYQQAIALAPDDATARNEYAALLARTGQLDAAADQLRALVARSPDRADVHNNLGIVLAQQGHLTEAAQEFRRALDIDPQSVQARRNLERLQHPQ
ncbi:MAG TPA: tetratricopeptide repeat protein [Vicinamibacterales bacterium]|jgi:Tfp pilus assembly protein PilF/4-amino-4-deoxy-L-arabinose transferase-like glycosyltransferase